MAPLFRAERSAAHVVGAAPSQCGERIRCELESPPGAGAAPLAAHPRDGVLAAYLDGPCGVRVLVRSCPKVWLFGRRYRGIAGVLLGPMAAPVIMSSPPANTSHGPRPGREKLPSCIITMPRCGRRARRSRGRRTPGGVTRSWCGVGSLRRLPLNSKADLFVRSAGPGGMPCWGG
jgi:hypothetical protein